ncbi:MAG: N-acetylglucosamine-specific PTS transporter subunit IIBC [Alphaproteobacteria bacterium]|nr:N-acetylglucosamine-specific PTS transporter subunit IIBC [Alphaproteobacteria bacterium]
MKSTVEILQPLGRALMLPIAVLPVAGILLRLGQPDVLNIAFIAAAGNAIFSNLGLLFAAGVAVGLARENHGAAGLAGVVCFLVATEGAKALMSVPVEATAGYLGTGTLGTAPQLAADAFKSGVIFKLGVPIGITSGLIAGWLYNRFHDVRLPEYLAFFGGRRFVPIVAGFSALLLALLIGLSWAGISHGMDAASHAVLKLGAFGLFIYGAVNRLLIVTGLHHILNNIAWFMLGDYHGVTGDLKRFFAGDPTAGAFMSGFFPVMMFGLPGACLAMYHCARPERRKEVGGLLASMALTAFLTGVTEPIEFSFMFLAPPLYAIHAVLTGVAMVVMNALDVHLGFGFSAGVFDYIINFGKATHPLMLLPVGAAYAALYYGIFRLAIQHFDLKTVGREDADIVPAPIVDAQGRGSVYVDALGGAANLQSVDACTTRLRLTVRSSMAIDEPRLRALGARGFVRPSPTSLQVVVGPAADQIAGEIRASLPQAGGRSVPSPAMSAARPAEPATAGVVAASPEAEVLLKGLGGRANVLSLSASSSRLMVELFNMALLDEGALRAAGARSVVKLKSSVQIVMGPQAEALAAGLRSALDATR